MMSSVSLGRPGKAPTFSNEGTHLAKEPHVTIVEALALKLLSLWGGVVRQGD
jgi:hypothetical protein